MLQSMQDMFQRQSALFNKCLQSVKGADLQTQSKSQAVAGVLPLDQSSVVSHVTGSQNQGLLGSDRSESSDHEVDCTYIDSSACLFQESWRDFRFSSMVTESEGIGCY